MKKLPLVFSGCLLGLIRKKSHKTNPVRLNKCDRTGQVSAIRFPAPARPNKQPENTKGSFFIRATFPMAGMILSTYVFRVFPVLPLVAQGIWWFSFLLDLALIATFTIKFA